MRMMIYIDSILDTRMAIHSLIGHTPIDYPYRHKDNIRAEYMSRDARVLHYAKPTDLDKILVYLVSHATAYEETMLSKSPNVDLLINMFPYDIPLEDYQAVLTAKYSWATNVTVIYQPPNLLIYKTCDIIVDYDALLHLDIALPNKPKDIIATIKGMEEVMLVTPLVFNELKVDKDPSVTADRLMREYVPLVRLEFVDVGFFNQG